MISPKTLAAEFVKSHSRRVSDVMIRQVISVSPEASLGEVATILEKNAIRRVPVVDNGKLVGILSRADIVRALMARSTIVPPTAFQDPELHDKVTAQLGKQTWTKPSSLSVVVHDGTVELWGVVDSEAEKDAVRVAAETTPGVGAVDDHVLVRPTEFA